MAFTWNPQAQRYVGPSGRFVPVSQVNAAVEQVISAAGQRMASLSEQLQTGVLSVGEWQTTMRQELKSLHLGAAATGRGGWQQMGFSEYGWTGHELRTQYGYLRGFAEDIQSGKQAMDGRFLSRTAMYAQAARGTQREMERRVAKGNGKTEERNILGAAERHCPQCPGLSGMGWVPIGTLPRVGGRSCLSRCRCSIQTRRAA